MAELHKLHNALGYTFQNENLLRDALARRSSWNENVDDGGRNAHNQRLEFLGDSILNYVISVALFDIYPDFDQNNLSEKRAKCVKNDDGPLSRLAVRFNLIDHLLTGRGERDLLQNDLSLVFPLEHDVPLSPVTHFDKT